MGMTRNGKIARLPHHIREEINHRLRDNVPGQKICDWLNRLPAVKAVCKEFAGRRGKKELPITVNHVSEWRRGGFQDWLREQQMLEGTREMARWSAKLAKDGGGELSEGAAVLLSGQLLKLLQGMAHFEKFHPPSSDYGATEVPSSKFQNRMDRTAEFRNEKSNNTPTSPENSSPPALSSFSEEREQSFERSEKNAPVGSDLSPVQVETNRRDACATTERMEPVVRVLGELVRCLSGIRRGDQNRVRLAQLDRKLAQRDKMIALEREKYDNEQAEIAAEKQEEERLIKEEERRQKRAARLSDEGKIDLLRGSVFGPDLVVAEREQQIKQLQKELEILKAEMPASTRASKGGTKDASPMSNVHPPSSDCGTTSSPKSDVASASGTGAPSGVEPIRVNTSACDQSQEKSGAEGGAEANFSTHPPAQSSGATRTREEASAFATLRRDEKAQGAKKFDVAAALREVMEIDKELAALWAELPVTETSSGHSQEQNGAGGEPGTECSTHPPAQSFGATRRRKDAEAQGPEKFDPDEALRQLERIKKELAALKAGREVSSSGNSQENGS
jgi:hypothetical protein